MKNHCVHRFTSLDAPVALIVGGTRMGTAIGRRLAQRGYRILLSYRQSRVAAQSTAQDIRSAGGHAELLQADLTQPQAAPRLIASIARQWKRLDLVVSLASIYEETPLEVKRSRQDWQSMIDANARSGFDLAVAAEPFLRKAAPGRVILISDWTAASGRPRYRGFAPYYVSKAAVKATVEALALEWAPKVLVNGIAPGPILPPPGLSRAEHRAVEKSTPLGRWGGAEEIAAAVEFLSSTAFVTGEVLRVDGGRHLY